MECKAFSARNMSGLAEIINKYFKDMDDYAIFHFSNVVTFESRGVMYFKILIFYEEELEPFPPPES